MHLIEALPKESCHFADESKSASTGTLVSLSSSSEAVITWCCKIGLLGVPSG